MSKSKRQIDGTTRNHQPAQRASNVQFVGNPDIGPKRGWEARNPGVAIRDRSHVMSERRLSRRAEATEAPGASLRKLAHYRHTKVPQAGLKTGLNNPHKLFILLVPGAGLEPALTLR